MTAQAKSKVVVCTVDAGLQNELRTLLKAWFDLEIVATFEGLTAVLQTSPRHAMIVELPTPTLSITQTPAVREQLIHVLENARKCFPVVRRIVVTDHCDLSLVIHGLHTGAIDSLIYRPIAVADLASALRPARQACVPTQRPQPTAIAPTIKPPLRPPIHVSPVLPSGLHR